ncbi:MAG: hypothetical protein NTZ90_16780 [Proteobacteria bacterium]|nr:hypothetical protein [Pseudomonadota bacterium]
MQVLAHELGHYYMSHQTTPSYQYGAFYRLGDTNPAQKPTSNPEAEALGKKLVDAFRGKIYFDDYASIEGQRFHSVLFSVLRNLAFELRAIECAGDSSCAKPCTLMAEFFADSAKLKPLEDFPWKKPGDDGINAYRAYEQLAQACVISIPLSNDPNVPGADQTPATSLKVSTVEQYLGYSSQELSNALKPLPLDENLGQLFDDVTSKIQDLQQAQASGMNQVLSEAMSFNLAVYTAEQEADELSAEWIDQLGINPAVGISSMIKLGREWAKREPPAFGEVPSDQCEALYQRGWRGEKGNSVMVPIAAWEGAHHSACYRAFNIDREIKVHNLTEYASTVRPEPGEPRWDEMVVSIVRRENL